MLWASLAAARSVVANGNVRGAHHTGGRFRRGRVLLCRVRILPVRPILETRIALGSLHAGDRILPERSRDPAVARDRQICHACDHIAGGFAAWNRPGRGHVGRLFRVDLGQLQRPGRNSAVLSLRWLAVAASSCRRLDPASADDADPCLGSSGALVRVRPKSGIGSIARDATRADTDQGSCRRSDLRSPRDRAQHLSRRRWGKSACRSS